MESLEIILSLAGAALGLLVTSATFIVKFLKKSNAKKAAEQVIEICNAILPYIEQAEKFVHYTGEEKKEYVMTKANQYALDHGIKFDAEYVGGKVEELISLTKEVNAKESTSGSDSSSATAMPAASKTITIPSR